MWATPDQGSDYLIGLYRAAWRHSDESISTLELDTPARVAWWPPGRRQTTFGSLLVRIVADTAHHARHCDIVRESIDGRPGRDHEGVGDDTWWTDYLARVQAAAEQNK